MEAFLRYVVSALVENPGELQLTQQESGNKTVYSLQLAKSDIGKIIGRQGRTITVLRNLLSIAAGRQERKAIIHIEE